MVVVWCWCGLDTVLRWFSYGYDSGVALMWYLHVAGMVQVRQRYLGIMVVGLWLERVCGLGIAVMLRRRLDVPHKTTSPDNLAAKDGTDIQ